MAASAAAAAAAAADLAALEETATTAATQETNFTPALTNIEEDKYEAQLQGKVERIRSLFAEFNPPELEPFRSQPKHYRMRTEFRVWHEKNDPDGLYYVMFEKGKIGEQRQVRVDQFPVASELVNQLMEVVMREARASPTLRTKLFQVTFHTTLSGEGMVTLIYHRKLDAKWQEEARRLQAVLATAPAAAAAPHVIGRSRGQKVVLGKDEVQECLEVDGQQLKYIQVEGSFSQPNAGICRSMLSWARSVTAPAADAAVGQAQSGAAHAEAKAPAPLSGGEALATGDGEAPLEPSRVPSVAPSRDLLELYCGNGNFTAAVAHNFRQVVATEVSKPSVAAAKRNFELNGVTNVFVARMSSEDFTEAWKEGRKMTRLQGLDLAGCDFQTLLVDPPRAGLDDQTRQLLRQFQNVVYISCNPDTLHRDLTAVRDLFQIKRFALFDQFPYTHHVECGVYLERKPGVSGASNNSIAAAALAAQAAARASDAAAAEVIVGAVEGQVSRGLKDTERAGQAVSGPPAATLVKGGGAQPAAAAGGGGGEGAAAAGGGGGGEGATHTGEASATDGTALEEGVATAPATAAELDGGRGVKRKLSAE
ncbi:hypothetical protein N2152v2_004062 [Parachlorella kessleri]